jgi:EAL domain-containing protein (putative c-di-GMP-specific phosphodiesterase class I)
MGALSRWWRARPLDDRAAANDASMGPCVADALRGALDRGEFLLNYQPKVDLATSEVTGFEALLRWRHEEFGAMGPAQFVPMLEDLGLIGAVGDWALRRACREAVRWIGRGAPFVPIAVNVSAKQLCDPAFAPSIASILAATGARASQLEIEITESALMEDVAQAARTLMLVRELGVRVAMDDFGVGQSSLAYLKRLPVDAIKIDRSFVADVASRPQDGAIVRAIIDLGRSLGLTVIAEGVETIRQRAFLIANGCDEIQGHFVSAPLPPHAALEMALLAGDAGGVRAARAFTRRLVAQGSEAA